MNVGCIQVSRIHWSFMEASSQTREAINIELQQKLQNQVRTKEHKSTTISQDVFQGKLNLV